MSPETAEKLEKVKRYSTSLRRVFGFALAVVGAAMVVYLIMLVVTPGRFDAPIDLIGIEYAGNPLEGTVGILAHVGTLLGLAVLLKFLLHLQKLFGLYAEGKIFTAEDVRQIRQIGITLLLFSALWLLGAIEALVVVPSAETAAHISVRSAPVGQLILGTIVIVASWIMDVGREMREEQDLVV